MVQDDKPVGLDGLQVEFDDERAGSDAGVVVAALAGAAGDVGAGRPVGAAAAGLAGAGNAARNVMYSIDDADVLRAGAFAVKRWGGTHSAP